METNNTTDVVVVDSQNNVNAENDELMLRLKVATQHKAPTEKKKDEWNFDLEEKEVIQDLNESESTATQNSSTDKKETAPGTENKPTKKLTDSAKRSSARIAVGMFDLTQKGVFIPLIGRKYKKKFTADEQDLLLALENKNEKDYTDKEQALSKKFEKLMNRMDKKIDEVPLAIDEKKDLEEAWFTYFDITEKELPPIYMVAMAMINSVGKRSIDLFTD